jgi:hypothetical protein
MKKEWYKIHEQLSLQKAIFVVWEKTGYPVFWNIPEDGDTPEECFRKQLKEFAEETKK